MKNIFILISMCCAVSSSTGQSRETYSDKFLTSTFRIFQSADFELAYEILPFIRKRFQTELEDSASFYNPYDSLSKYINIRFASDSLLKTYSWSERSDGCCHASATYAQFKTKTGKINYVDLEALDNTDGELFITDLQKIVVGNETYYLILGWGTCCGGKHYCVARAYEISGDTLVKTDSLFGGSAEIYAGANRSQKIEMRYSPELKILSYNGYGFDNEIGFYTNEMSRVNWKLTRTGFTRVDP